MSLFAHLGVGVAAALAALPSLVNILFLILSLNFLSLLGWRNL